MGILVHCFSKIQGFDCTTVFQTFFTLRWPIDGFCNEISQRLFQYWNQNRVHNNILFMPIRTRIAFLVAFDATRSFRVIILITMAGNRLGNLCVENVWEPLERWFGSMAIFCINEKCFGSFFFALTQSFFLGKNERF